MNKTENSITQFYSAFAGLDVDAMSRFYADDVTFDDEAFSLRGKAQVMGMWRMLCETTKAKALADWKLEFSDVSAEGNRGRAHWDAHYRFSATNRLVLNRIDAQFTFNPQGLVVQHTDSFDFWAWARQSLGAPGLLLGWTPFLRNKVRTQAAANLAKFMSKVG